MASFLIRRTWPCKYQESIEAKGWGLAAGQSMEDDKPRPCPLHGATCPRHAGA